MTVSLAVLAACAPPPDDGAAGKTASPILFGTAPSDLYGEFNTIRITIANTGIVCSGVVIGTFSVLTASHCIPNGTPLGNINMAFGSTQVQSQVSSMVRNPSGIDLAVLTSSNPGFPGVFDSYRYMWPLSSSSLAGRTLTCEGWGLSFPRTYATTVLHADLPANSVALDVASDGGADVVTMGGNASGQALALGDDGAGCFGNINGVWFLAGVVGVPVNNGASPITSTAGAARAWLDSVTYRPSTLETALSTNGVASPPEMSDRQGGEDLFFVNSAGHLEHHFGFAASGTDLGAPSAGLDNTYRPASVSWHDPGRVDVFVRGGPQGLPNGGVFQRFASGGVWQPGWGQITQMGNIISGPAVASWGQSRLDLFGIMDGPTGHVIHAWYDNGWSPTTDDLGGTFEPSISPDLSAVSWGPGRIDIVGAAGGQVVHKFFDNGWGPSFTTWEGLGGSPATGTGPTISSRGPGRLDIFFKGTNQHLFHRWFNGVWLEQWIDLGFTVPGQPASDSATDNDGLIDLVARDPATNKVWFDQN